MAIASTQRRQQISRLQMTGMFVSLASYLIVFPLAAWNHHAVLLVGSALMPLVMAQFVLYHSGKTLFVGLFTTKHAIQLFVLAVLGMLIWNHQWFLALLLLAVEIFINGKSMRKK